MKDKRRKYGEDFELVFRRKVFQTSQTLLEVPKEKLYNWNMYNAYIRIYSSYNKFSFQIRLLDEKKSMVSQINLNWKEALALKSALEKRLSTVKAARSL